MTSLQLRIQVAVIDFGRPQQSPVCLFLLTRRLPKVGFAASLSALVHEEFVLLTLTALVSRQAVAPFHALTLFVPALGLSAGDVAESSPTFG